MPLTEEEEDELKRLQLAKLRREEAELRERQEAVARRRERNERRRQTASDALEKVWGLSKGPVMLFLVLFGPALAFLVIGKVILTLRPLIEWIF